MNAFKSLSDDEVEQAWIDANKHVSRTFDHPPIVTQGGGAAISEHVHRRELLAALDKERSRRCRHRRKTSGSATVWEKSYTMCGGKDGTEILPPSYHAMVGKNFVGWVRSNPWNGNDCWEWEVYQTSMGRNNGSDTCKTLEAAKASVEKRIERWFKDYGIDRTQLG